MWRRSPGTRPTASWPTASAGSGTASPTICSPKARTGRPSTRRCRSSGAALAGACMVSDAFFPFRDGVDVGIREGITAVIQPGGSERDYRGHRGLQRGGCGHGVHRPAQLPPLDREKHTGSVRPGAVPGRSLRTGPGGAVRKGDPHRHPVRPAGRPSEHRCHHEHHRARSLGRPHDPQGLPRRDRRPAGVRAGALRRQGPLGQEHERSGGHPLGVHLSHAPGCLRQLAGSGRRAVRTGGAVSTSTRSSR